MRRTSGLLLTGGASRRMGFDKALLVVSGSTLALRLAGILGEVCEPCIEVGPGRSGLRAVQEEPPGGGPLAAVAAGRSELLRLGRPGPALVLACDLPFVEVTQLELIAGWPGDDSVLPTVGGRDQPLCARWSAVDLDAAALALARGERSLRSLPDRARAVRLDEEKWSRSTRARAFADVDTPEDLDRLGISTG